MTRPTARSTDQPTDQPVPSYVRAAVEAGDLGALSAPPSWVGEPGTFLSTTAQRATSLPDSWDQDAPWVTSGLHADLPASAADALLTGPWLSVASGVVADHQWRLWTPIGDLPGDPPSHLTDLGVLVVRSLTGPPSGQGAAAIGAGVDLARWPGNR